MKNLILLLSLFSVGLTNLKAQETTLFDSEGTARAYIDYGEDATIFLWDGTPVAFLENDGGDLCVFGFNGNFLGWYEEGIIYDKRGNVAGAREGALNMMTKMEPMKSMQRMTPMRPMTPMTPMKPMWSNRWSSASLTEVLYSGKK
jgi:hypothetical protein